MFQSIYNIWAAHKNLQSTCFVSVWSNNVLNVMFILTQTQPRYPHIKHSVLYFANLTNKKRMLSDLANKRALHLALCISINHRFPPSPSPTAITPDTVLAGKYDQPQTMICPYSLLTSHPGVQRQAPSTGLQLPSCWHWHVLVQLVPCRPSGHTESHLWWGRGLNYQVLSIFYWQDICLLTKCVNDVTHSAPL